MPTTRRQSRQAEAEAAAMDVDGDVAMADADDANVGAGAASQWYCHSCDADIDPVLPGYTCPQCNGGFIELVEDGVCVFFVGIICTRAHVRGFPLLAGAVAGAAPLSHSTTGGCMLRRGS